MRASTLSKSSGFTLMELVLAIVIVGILATVATSKFISVDAQARSASMQSLAGAISTGSALNKAALAAKSPGAFSVSEASVCNAASLSRFSQAPLPSSVAVSGSGSCSSGAVAQCTISSASQSAAVQVHCANASPGTPFSPPLNEDEERPTPYTPPAD